MVQAFRATYVVPNRLVRFLLEGEKLVDWVPFIPSTSEVYQEIFDDVLEVSDDVFIQGPKPNSSLVVECKSECSHFSGLGEGFISSAYLLEPLYVVVCITETKETGD